MLLDSYRRSRRRRRRRRKGGKKGTETAQTLDHVGRVRWREQDGEQGGEQEEPEIIANNSMNYLNSTLYASISMLF